MKFATSIVLLTFTLFTVFGCWMPVLAQNNEQPKLTLGVIPFQAAGVKIYEAVSLSNRLHSELVKTQQFRVVEMENVNEVLNEIGFQQAGFCTDEECAARVGNMLGAQWMVTGSVGKVGRTYTVDVRMIDVESRQVFLTTSRNFRGVIDGLLNLMDGIANELAMKTAQRLKTGSLEIICQPNNAFVYLDGKIKGRTPLTLKTVSVGDHLIEIKYAGYQHWKETITIKPLQQKIIRVDLKKFCQLKILSYPVQANIYINGKLIAKTPWVEKILQGNYTIKVSKSKYISQQKKVNLTRDEKIFFELQKQAGLQDKVTKSRQKRVQEHKLSKKKSGKGWLWAVGSAVVIGGGVAVLLILKSGNEGSPSDVIGTPPEPPRNH